MFVSRRVATALITVALGAGIIGCGSNDGDDTGPAAGAGGPSTGEPLQIFFPTLNSAYIPGSDRKFKIPAVVQGVRADKWTCSDPAAVDFEIDGVMNGVMITTKKAGDFKITATAGKRSGTVPIHITAATEDDYTRGEARYNNAIPLMFMPGQFMGMGGQMVTFMMNNVSCKNCHGSGANFLAVEHTPQQTGGYNDEEIKNIFENGMKPPGAKWGSLPGIMNFYPQFHKWAASDEEYQGLVVYLRSMEPKSQGMLDFQGLISMFRMNMGMGMGQMTSATGTAGAPADMGTAGAAP